MNTTATAALEAQRSNRVRATMFALFDRLKSFVRAYPIRDEGDLPEHDIVWVTGVDDSPEKAIHDAILSNPALWRDALPPTVVVVPLKALQQAGLSDDVIEAFKMMGGAEVENAAHRHQYLSENRSR